MGLTNSKEEQLRNMPQIAFRVTKSKDGRYIINKTTITDIKPVAYYEKVMENPPEEQASGV